MRDIKAVQYSTFATTAADDGVAPPLVHPLDNAGLLSKLVFSWAGPLVALGNERQLALKDMWSLQPANKVAKISSTFKVAYNAKGKSVLGGFFSMYWVQFWCLGAMQLFSVVANLYGPGYVLGEIISIVQAPSFDTTYALQLIGSLLAIQIANVFVTAHMNFLDSVVSLQFMAAIRSMLFEKAMNLNAASRKVKSTGEITNLVSTDAARVMEFGLNAHQFWIVPIQVGCVLYLLYNLVGWSIFVGFGVVIAIVVVNAIVAVLLGSTQKEFSTLKDLRMKLVNELFGSIQVVKFNAWEEKFLASVRDLRATEVNAIWKFMRYLVFLLTFLRGAPTLVTISVFATFTLWMRQTLTITIVFSTLALFTALQDAIMTLPMVILNLVQALVSAKRIDEFLHLDERDDDVVMTPRTARAAADIYASDRAVVAIESGHFGWDDHTPFFKNINLKVRQGEFVVVHGAVGAGKSSLCSILLGEMHKTGGTVFVGGDVAYFSQQPWIQHTTVRENILFGRPYDRVKYQAVVDACALTADMASFPAGDRAEIGPKGLNLSGGQKARISLARACYSDADIYILDSPLSAVDAIVAKEIFSKCFLGLLKHKTVILVTHSPEIIESGDVDRLILIQDGQLVERATSGTAAQASSEPPLVAPLRPTKAYWDDESNLPVYLPVHREYDMLLTPSATTPYNFHASEMLFTQKVTLSGTHTFDDLGRLVVEEECREGRVSKSVANRYFNAMGGWLSVAVVVLTSVGAQGVQLATDLWLTHWSNQSGSMDPAAFAAATDANMIVYALLGCATCVAFAVQMSAMYGFGLVASQKLFDDMLTNLLQVPMQFFDTNPIGRILNRFSDDVMACDIMLANTFVTMVGMVLFIVSTAGTAIFIMQWYGLGVLPLLYVYVRLGAYYLSPLRDLNRLQKTTRSPVITLISEGIDGSVTIRAYGDKQLRRFYRLQQSNVETFCATMFAQTALRQWFTLRVQLISCAIVTLMLLTIVVLQGALSHGFVGLLVTYGLTLPSSLENMVSIWARIETDMIAPERICDYIAIAPEGARRNQLTDVPSWPATGQVVFDNVSFRYKPNDPLVLKNVSFNVQGGEKVGIVGRTGAGKSSLMMALFRMNEVASGSIVIDGVNIATVGLKHLRSSLAIIPQNPVLFKGTLRNYLDPFDEYTDDQLWDALRKVKLMDRLAGVEEKLLGPVEENGENFSVGERQMLCMARALLHQAKIVVLDEATAAIDHETDQLLQRVIRDEFATSTVLTIAHRLDTVLDCDRIMVLDQGQLAQCDAPKELVSQGTGIFFELVTEGGYMDKMVVS